MKKTKDIIAGTVMAGTMALQGTAGNAQGPIAPTHSAEEIRPFKIHVSDKELVDLKKRIQATKWPDAEIIKDESQGVQLATMQALAKYWATDYDWRKIESKLNAFLGPIVSIIKPRNTNYRCFEVIADRSLAPPMIFHVQFVQPAKQVCLQQSFQNIILGSFNIQFQNQVVFRCKSFHYESGKIDARYFFYYCRGIWMSPWSSVFCATYF